MNSAEMFLQQFGTPAVPIEEIRKVFYPELGRDRFRRDLYAGKLDLPAIYFRDSQKAHLIIDVRDLAVWYDARRSQAERNYQRLKIAA